MLPVHMKWQFGGLVRCFLGVATALLHLVSYVSASGQGTGTVISPRVLLDPISFPIHVLENLKRSPADNTTFGAGLGSVGMSTNMQSYYTVIQVGGIYFRVALDTASADLWLVSSSCVTDSCKKVPPYPLSYYYSPTFVSIGDNTTLFRAHYVDDTSASGFLAGETVRIANLTLSNQTFGLATSSNLTLTNMISGILGLGFPRLSSFSKKNSSKPFFANLAAGGWLEYPLFALSLTMDSSGTLSLGAIDASIVKNASLIRWYRVAQFPPFAAENNGSNYLEWAIPITGFSVNGTSFTPVPTYTNVSRTTLALFDIGSPGIYGSYQDVSRIFTAIKGARLVDSGQWAIPCQTTVPISFTFGTNKFHLLPTDYIRGPASGNPNLCLSWPMALPPSSDGVDWQFGATFLRTVYSIFSFGINGKEPPLIGLYPLRNYTNITDQTQSPADIDSYLSAYSATIPTTLPNYLLTTPSFTTPPYTFNNSVPVVQGGIVSTGLANPTYSPIFREKTSMDNVSALPRISPPPSVITLTVTESGRLSTTTKTILSPSILLGLPSSSVTIQSDGSVLVSLICVSSVIFWESIFAWTF